MNKKTIVVVIVIILAVCAAGIFYFAKSKKTIAPVKTEEKSNAEIVERKEKKEKDMSNWKFYRNEEFGFEIRYPENWAIDNSRSNKNKVVFNPGLKDVPGSIEAINFRKNEDNLNLDEIIKKQRNNYRQVIKKEDFLFINNEKAWKIETTEFAISRIFFVHEGIVYEIESMGHLIDEDILNEFVFLK